MNHMAIFHHGLEGSHANISLERVISKNPIRPRQADRQFPSSAKFQMVQETLPLDILWATKVFVTTQVTQNSEKFRFWPVTPWGVLENIGPLTPVPGFNLWLPHATHTQVIEHRGHTLCEGQGVDPEWDGVTLDGQPVSMKGMHQKWFGNYTYQIHALLNCKYMQ